MSLFRFTLGWRRSLPTLLVALFVWFNFAGSPLRADEDEHDFREVLEAGEVMSLGGLLARIRQDVEGRVLKVELERESDDEKPRWIYEAKVLTPEGHVLNLEYDAKNLELLGIKGRHGRQHHDEEDD